MFRLEGYRVISGKQCWIPLGEFSTVEELLANVGRWYALEWRLVVVATGEIVLVEWIDDKEERDCVLPYIPQIIVDRLNNQKQLF